LKTRSLQKCILIRDPSIAALFSGWDVWLIPYDIETFKMQLDKVYVGDDWFIKNNEILGYESEQCFIAVEPNSKIGLIE
jgi:hypothetical protein